MALSKKLRIALIALALSSPLFAGEDWTPHVIGPFGTLNTRDNAYTLPANQSPDMLNVNITAGGKSIVKRSGYGIAQSLTPSTSVVHGVYTFYESSGSTIDLYAIDRKLFSSVGGAAATTLISTGTNGATWQCTDSLGFAYCANTGRTTITKTNGTTVSFIATVASTGTMLATAVTRLAMAGFAEAPSRIDFSADSDFTSWGSGALGTSPAQFTINAPGARITHIVYAFGRIIWFKDSSFGYILIGNQPFQTDWIIRTISFDVGTNDNTSVYREGILYFRGQDGNIYAFDGSNYEMLSREISGTIALAQSRTSNSWVQSSQSDFASGAQVPAGFVSTAAVAGSITTLTASVTSYFHDTSAVNFASGTLTSLSSSAVDGDLYLALASTNTKENATCTASGALGVCNTFGEIGRSFTSTQNVVLAGVAMNMQNTSPGGLTGTMRISLRADSSGSPGTVIITSDTNVTAIDGNATQKLFNFPSPVAVSSGTRYWITAQMLSGNCSNASSIYVQWALDTACSATEKHVQNGSIVSAGGYYDYRVIGYLHATSGNIVSRTFDVGFTTNSWVWNWGLFRPVHDLYGQTITYETQTSSDATNWTSLVSVSSGASPTSTVQRYIRYKASFSTSDTNKSPVLHDVNLSLYPGSYFSQVKNAPSLGNWDAFQANASDGGGSLTYYMRSANSSFAVTSTATWTSLTPGSVPSISTGSYFQVRVDFNAVTSTNSPSLNDFTVNWFEGSATDKAYATYFDDKIWWAIAYGAGASGNNRIIAYDLLNKGWVFYDIASNGFLVRNNSLYFGSSTAGYVYRYGGSTSDNGAAINAYWRSKDLFGENPFGIDDIANISIAAKSVQNSSMTVTYTMNGSSDTSYTMSLYNPTGTFINKNRNVSLGTFGNTFAIKFGNNAADQPFEVFAIQVGVRPRSWIPTP